ncbi:MAG: alpha/beta hydrolase, partial [Planctomycetota bacterium]
MNRPLTRRQLLGSPRIRSLALLLVVLIGGCQRTLVGTPNLYLAADADPFADVPPALRSSTIDLLYVTDRRAEGERDGRMRYRHFRSISLAWGSYTVQIGNGVTWTELVEASRTQRRAVNLPLRSGTVIEHGRFPETPPPMEMVDGQVVVTSDYVANLHESTAAFHDELQRRLELTPRKEVFVFVHGFNNSIANAAFRLAELWHMLGREGVPLLYSWPAGAPGLIKGYTYDRESSEFTIYHFKQLLTALRSCPGVSRVHLIGHSRGTDVVLTALRELLLQTDGTGRDPRSDYRMGHVVLAAPDIDLQVSQQRNVAEQIPRILETLTIYVTPNDRAL